MLATTMCLQKGKIEYIAQAFFPISKLIYCKKATVLMFFSFLHFFSHFYCIIKANMPEWGGMEQPRSGKVGTPLSRFGIKQIFFLFPPQNLLHMSAYVQLQAPVKMLKQIFWLFLSPKSTVHVSLHVNLCKGNGNGGFNGSGPCSMLFFAFYLEGMGWTSAGWC